MDFELSDDQQALGAAARDLLDDLSDHHAVRSHLVSGAPFDARLFEAMADQGWLGVALEESDGGLGLGWVEAVVLLEELGRHTAPVPFLPSLLALSALARSRSGGGPVPDKWIAELAAGRRLGCVGWSDERAGSVASRLGTSWALTGRFGLVEGAAVADVAILAVADGVFAVDLSVTGRPPSEPAMDRTRTMSWLVLEDAPAIRLGGENLATDLIDLGAVGTSAELLGGACRVLELSARYAKDRVQFGRPIGSFQAVKHRCADMVVDTEGMRSATWYAAWSLSNRQAGRSLDASTAKVWCNDASRRVMASGLQIHGGIGFTWEHDFHLYLKRSQFEQCSFGDGAYHRRRLSGLLHDRLVSGTDLF
ncbi:MAG: acyl-CoA dehydrogenase family protein [Acidimicrobiales bacterium]